MEEENHWLIRKRVADILIEDLLQNSNSLEISNSATNKRNYVRSLFAYYELVLTNLRESVGQRLFNYWKNSETFNIHEFTPLLDSSVRVNEKGEIRLEANKLPFLNLLRYTLNLYCKLIDLNNIFFSSHGWEAFRLSVEIRNRITHPSIQKDIDISDKEIITINLGRDWWNKVLGEIHDHIIKYDK